MPDINWGLLQSLQQMSPIKTATPMAQGGGQQGQSQPGGPQRASQGQGNTGGQGQSQNGSQGLLGGLAGNGQLSFNPAMTQSLTSPINVPQPVQTSIATAAPQAQPSQNVAPSPDSGGGGMGGGLGSLLGGKLGGALSGLGSNGMSGIGNMIGLGKSNPVSTANSAINSTMQQMNPQGLAGALMGQTQQKSMPQQVNNAVQGPQAPQMPQGNQQFQNITKPLMGQSAGSQTLNSFLQKSNPGLDPSKTPWCAGFANSVLSAEGLKGTGSLAAKSFNSWGNPTTNPKTGDIAVFNDMTGKNDPAHGHVGFVQNVDYKTGMVSVLGGNQSGKVGVNQYPLKMVDSFRTAPTGQEIKQYAENKGINTPQELMQHLTGQKGESSGQQPLKTGVSGQPSAPIQQAIQGAQQVYKDNPVMSGVAASQAILESRLNGSPSGLAKDHNNYFGIKGSGTAGSVNMRTQEYGNNGAYNTNAGFAANKTPADSFTQHRHLMENGTKSNPHLYQKVMNAGSVEEAAHELQKAGYATDPHYADQLIKIYHQYVEPNQQTASQGT